MRPRGVGRGLVALNFFFFFGGNRGRRGKDEDALEGGREVEAVGSAGKGPSARRSERKVAAAESVITLYPLFVHSPAHLSAPGPPPSPSLPQLSPVPTKETEGRGLAGFNVHLLCSRIYFALRL